MSEPLQEYDGVLHSRMGAAFPGSHAIFRGQDLHRDLHDLDWLELYVYGITGRRFTPEQLRLLHAIWIYTSYPDARIWNNRVAALAGSTRSSGSLGIAAALAISEATIYGRHIDIRTIDFLLRTRHTIKAGGTLNACIRDEFSSKRSVPGYGRPIVNGDERNPHLLDLAHKLGLGNGTYVRLAYAIEEALITGRWRVKMTYGALCAALAADLGLSPREYYLFMFPAFLAGMPPCYIEATEQPEGALYAMACGAVAYEGECPRCWPGKTSP